MLEDFKHNLQSNILNTQSQFSSIAFAGGGTGGHIYPGLAVAAELKENSRLPSLRIFWIGSDKDLDRTIVESAGIEFFAIPSGKLRRYFSLQNLFDVFNIITGFFAARKILKREKPALLFSKGGFVSVPPVIAAYSLKIPVFTHESDFSPGLATKINSRFSNKIFAAYQDTVSQFPAKYREKIVVTGNPVRSTFHSADPALGRSFLGIGKEERILLVLGGSQGAKEINDLVRKMLPELINVYTVVHQTGSGGDLPPPPLLYPNRYKPYPYIKDEMPHILAAAEIVLGRSGAGTVWECATAGKPMVLVPLRGSGTRGDQVENARFFERAGAAVMLTDTENLASIILSLANDKTKREQMAAASARVGSLDGAGIIATSIGKVIGKDSY